MGERGGDVGDGDREDLERRGRREVEKWGDDGAVVVGEDLVEVAVDGGGEEIVGGARDGEIGRERDCLWVGPLECGGVGPDVDRVSDGCGLRNGGGPYCKG